MDAKSVKQILLPFVQQITQENGRKVANGYTMFHSPFRTDHDPSFGVRGDRWHDFGSGDSGDVVDLFMSVNHVGYLDAIRSLLKGNYSAIAPHVNDRPKIEERAIVTPIVSYTLIDYARSRKVADNVLYDYCNEVTIERNGRRYFYIGFPSSLGGWELRNGTNSKMAKRTYGEKSYSWLKYGLSEVAIFEGFFDFLSFQSINRKQIDIIVLNSVSELPKITDLLTEYKTIHTYLDNDLGGKTATNALKTAYSNVIDHSSAYLGFNDVNDYLCHRTG